MDLYWLGSLILLLYCLYYLQWSGSWHAVFLCVGMATLLLGIISVYRAVSLSDSHANTSKRSHTLAHRGLKKAPRGRATAKNKVKGLLSWWCLLIDWSVNNAVREEKVSAVSNGAASVLFSRGRMKRQRPWNIDGERRKGRASRFWHASVTHNRQELKENQS